MRKPGRHEVLLSLLKPDMLSGKITLSRWYNCAFASQNLMHGQSCASVLNLMYERQAEADPKGDLSILLRRRRKT